MVNSIKSKIPIVNYNDYSIRFLSNIVKVRPSPIRCYFVRNKSASSKFSFQRKELSHIFACFFELQRIPFHNKPAKTTAVFMDISKMFFDFGRRKLKYFNFSKITSNSAFRSSFL